jgi:hypothetical protein
MDARRALLLAIFAVLATGGCERLLGEKGEAPAIERALADRIVERLCERLAEVYPEEGPLTVYRLPEMKEEVAKAEGIEGGWAEFRRRVQSTDPSLDLAYSRRITEELRRLFDAEEDK